MLRGSGSNAAHMANVGAQLAARTEGAEAASSTSQIASLNDSKRASTFEQAPKSLADPLRTDVSTVRSADGTLNTLASQDAVKANRQFQARLFDEAASLQIVAHDKDGNARKSIDGATDRTAHIPPLVAKRPACLIEKEAFVLLECQGKSQSFGSSPGGGWIETCLVFKDRI